MRKTLFSILLYLSFCLGASAQDQIENIDKYHKNSKWQKATALELFETFAKKEPLQGDVNLLDVCSGDGKITHTMGKMLPKGHITGVDFSEKMVKFSRQHYGSHNITFETMNAAELSFSKKFDIITSFTCMHLIPNQKDVLESMHYNLKTNGKLLMQFPITHGFGSALDEVTTSKKWRRYFFDFKPPWHFFSANEYKIFLQEAGFTLKRVEVITKDETYPNKMVFAASISHWLPHLKKLPKNLRADFLNDLLTAYLQYVPMDPHGKIHFYVDNLIVNARKA